MIHLIDEEAVVPLITRIKNKNTFNKAGRKGLFQKKLKQLLTDSVDGHHLTLVC